MVACVNQYLLQALLPYLRVRPECARIVEKEKMLLHGPGDRVWRSCVVANETLL